VKDANEMGEKRLENTQLNVVHQVGSKDRVKIKAKPPELGVEGILWARVSCDGDQAYELQGSLHVLGPTIAHRGPVQHEPQ
jgi:hypothetical protein